MADSQLSSVNVFFLFIVKFDEWHNEKSLESTFDYVIMVITISTCIIKKAALHCFRGSSKKVSLLKYPHHTNNVLSSKRESVIAPVLIKTHNRFLANVSVSKEMIHRVDNHIVWNHT